MDQRLEELSKEVNSISMNLREKENQITDLEMQLKTAREELNTEKLIHQQSVIEKE